MTVFLLRRVQNVVFIIMEIIVEIHFWTNKSFLGLDSIRFIVAQFAQCFARKNVEIKFTFFKYSLDFLLRCFTTVKFFISCFVVVFIVYFERLILC